jgi:hypothetical protein
MFEVSDFALRGVYGRIPIASVFTFVDAAFFEVNQFLGVAKDIGGSLIDRDGDGITQPLVPFAAMDSSTTDPVRWSMIMRHDYALQSRNESYFMCINWTCRGDVGRAHAGCCA